MSEPHAQASQPSSERVAYEPCLCREVFDLLRARLGVSDQVHQHLVNARIEVLKAVRGVIDERIEHLSKKTEHGTKIAVE
jgi:hypothetical protein